jgi:hypothetical protein
MGAIAVNAAKPMNLGARMIHAFLDNVRRFAIELTGRAQLRVVRPSVEEVPQPVSIRHRNE